MLQSSLTENGALLGVPADDQLPSWGHSLLPAAVGNLVQGHGSGCSSSVSSSPQGHVRKP